VGPANIRRRGRPGHPRHLQLPAFRPTPQPASLRLPLLRMRAVTPGAPFTPMYLELGLSSLLVDGACGGCACESGEGEGARKGGVRLPLRPAAASMKVRRTIVPGQCEVPRAPVSIPRRSTSPKPHFPDPGVRDCGGSYLSRSPPTVGRRPALHHDATHEGNTCSAPRAPGTARAEPRLPRAATRGHAGGAGAWWQRRRRTRGLARRARGPRGALVLALAPARRSAAGAGSRGAQRHRRRRRADRGSASSAGAAGAPEAPRRAPRRRGRGGHGRYVGRRRRRPGRHSVVAGGRRRACSGVCGVRPRGRRGVQVLWCEAWYCGAAGACPTGYVCGLRAARDCPRQDRAVARGGGPRQQRGGRGCRSRRAARAPVARPCARAAAAARPFPRPPLAPSAPHSPHPKGSSPPGLARARILSRAPERACPPPPRRRAAAGLLVRPLQGPLRRRLRRRRPGLQPPALADAQPPARRAQPRRPQALGQQHGPRAQRDQGGAVEARRVEPLPAQVQGRWGGGGAGAAGVQRAGVLRAARE
jgi:hypothetical protein